MTKAGRRGQTGQQGTGSTTSGVCRTCLYATSTTNCFGCLEDAGFACFSVRCRSRSPFMSGGFVSPCLFLCCLPHFLLRGTDHFSFFFLFLRFVFLCFHQMFFSFIEYVCCACRIQYDGILPGMSVARSARGGARRVTRLRPASPPQPPPGRAVGGKTNAIYAQTYARKPSNKVRLNSRTSKRRVSRSEPYLLVFYYRKRA